MGGGGSSATAPTGAGLRPQTRPNFGHAWGRMEARAVSGHVSPPQKRPVKIKQISSQDVFCRVMAGWAARPPTVTAHPAGIHCRFAEYPAATPK